MEPEVQAGDTVTLRKPHPCGGKAWLVTRTGADIGLRCLQCGHVVLLPRHEFRTRVKTIERPSAGTETDSK
ncbi:MAG: DUF951 domain-containing protein [Dehalococcoidia bacterium]|nr:DUF951 domain-containing protein [Dehalococcoidia bacterium]